MNREQIMRDYADFCEIEQKTAESHNYHLSNSILIRPLITFFATEHEGAKYRGFLTSEATRKDRTAKQVILDTIEYYRGLNPEALETVNGVKVVKPSWMLLKEEQQRAEYNLKKISV
jgi:hypothetical protein